MVVVLVTCALYTMFFSKHLLLIGQVLLPVQLHVGISVFVFLSKNSLYILLLCVWIIFFMFCMQEYDSFNVLLLNILWYMWLLEKCFLTRLMKIFPKFVLTDLQYGGL